MWDFQGVNFGRQGLHILRVGVVVWYSGLSSFGGHIGVFSVVVRSVIGSSADVVGLIVTYGSIFFSSGLGSQGAGVDDTLFKFKPWILCNNRLHKKLRVLYGFLDIIL